MIGTDMLLVQTMLLVTREPVQGQQTEAVRRRGDGSHEHELQRD